MKFPKKPSRPTVIRLSKIVGALYVVYVLFGFFGVPRIIKSVLEGKVAETLDRTVTLEKASFNPFLLSTTLTGLKIEDDHGSTLLELGHLYSNNQLFPLVLGRLSVKRFELHDTTIKVSRGADGITNIDRLIAMASEPSKEEPGQPPAFRLGLIDVANFKVEIVDLNRGFPLEETIGPMAFVAENLHSDPNSESPYGFDARFGEGGSIVWRGVVSLNPIASSGSFRIENLDISRAKPFWHDIARAEIGGALTVAGDYVATMNDAGPIASLKNGEVLVAGFSFQDPENDTRASWSGLSVSDMSASYPEMRVRIGSMTVTSPHALAVRNEIGAIDSPLKEQPEDAAEAEESFDEPSMDIVVDRFEVVSGSFEAIDRSISDKPEVSINALSLVANNLAPFDAEAEASIAASFSVFESGLAKLEMTSNIVKQTAEGTFAFDGFELSSLQNLATHFSNADIKSGTLSLNVEFKVDVPEENFEVMADAQIDSIAVSELESETSLFEAASMVLKGASFKGELLEIDRMELNAPIATVALTGAGLKLTGLMKSDGTEEAEVVEEGETELTTEIELPIDVNIREIAIVDGRANLEDRTIEPLHKASMTGFAFSGQNITTQAGINATISMKGSFDRGGSFSVDGELEPLDFKNSSNLTMALNGFDLSATAPYWKKYLGRGLDKGMLNINADIVIEKSQLEGGSGIKVDQLKLGEKVQSEDSLGLPIGFAVAVLQDRKGLIELPPLKLAGDLDDPSVGIAGIVMKTLGNVILKIVTSPFAMFGGGGGGDGDDLNTAAFLGGAYELDSTQQERLDKVAKILEDRPGLKLDLTSLVAEKTESHVFKRILIANTSKPDSEGTAEPADPLAMLNNFDQAQYEQAAKGSYRDVIALFGDLVEGESGEAKKSGLGGLLGGVANVLKTVTGAELDSDLPSLDEIEATLFSEKDLPVDLSWLNQLADEREKNVKDYLIREKGIDPSRVFISGENQLDTSVEKSAVQFELTD